MIKSERLFQFSGTISSPRRTSGLKSSQVHYLLSPVVCPKVHFSLKLNSQTYGHSPLTTIKTYTRKPSSNSISNRPRCNNCSKPSCSSKFRVVQLHQIAIILPSLTRLKALEAHQESQALFQRNLRIHHLDHQTLTLPKKWVCRRQTNSNWLSLLSSCLSRLS